MTVSADIWGGKNLIYTVSDDETLLTVSYSYKIVVKNGKYFVENGELSK